MEESRVPARLRATAAVILQRWSSRRSSQENCAIAFAPCADVLIEPDVADVTVLMVSDCREYELQSNHCFGNTIVKSGVENDQGIKGDKNG